EGTRGRAEDGRVVPQARDQRADVLQLEGKVRRAGSFRGEAAEGAGERERQAQEAPSRYDARQRRVEGFAGKKMVTPAAKREAVAHLRSTFEMSERRACRIIGCVRMTVRYRSRRVDDSSLRTRLRALAHERRRFGYRRLHLFLQREGFQVNHKRLFRIYKEGAADGAPPRRPQTSAGNAGTDTRSGNGK